MLLEFKGICQHCAEDVNILVHNGSPRGACPKCGDAPFDITPIQGVLYIVSNPNQRGVKIGITSKTVEQRIKSLNTTGVAGKFLPIAIFPTKKPKAHEKKVHEKLKRYRIEKEHFDLDSVEAVLKIYRELNRSIYPIFYDSEVKEMFRLRLEKARIDMEIKLRGKKK